MSNNRQGMMFIFESLKHHFHVGKNTLDLDQKKLVIDAVFAADEGNDAENLSSYVLERYITQTHEVEEVEEELENVPPTLRNPIVPPQSEELFNDIPVSLTE